MLLDPLTLVLSRRERILLLPPGEGWDEGVKIRFSQLRFRPILQIGKENI
jgi:hypothetical protein